MLSCYHDRGVLVAVYSLSSQTTGAEAEAAGVMTLGVRLEKFSQLILLYPRG